MKTAIAIAFASLAGLSAMPAAHADTNVAYLATVSTFGGGIGDSAGAAWGGGLGRLDSVTDGEYVPIGQQWNFGSVYWSGADSGVTITLNRAATVGALALQADSNDKYRIEYLGLNNVWKELTTVEVNKNGAGLDTYGGFLPTPVVASAFRIHGIGDNHYALSEFQVTGEFLPAATLPAAPVPEPSTYAMLLAGLGLLGFCARRRQR